MEEYFFNKFCIFHIVFFFNAKSLIAEANQIMKFNDVDELAEYFKGILCGCFGSQE